MAPEMPVRQDRDFDVGFAHWLVLPEMTTCNYAGRRGPDSGRRKFFRAWTRAASDRLGAPY